MKTLLLTTLAAAVSFNALSAQIYDLSGQVVDWNVAAKLKITSDSNGVIKDKNGQVYKLKGKYIDQSDLKNCSDGKFIITTSVKFDRKMERQGYQIAPMSCDLQQVNGSALDEELLNTDYSFDKTNIEQIKTNEKEIRAYIKKHLGTEAHY